jgi:enterochelin esterase family protein
MPAKASSRTHTNSPQLWLTPRPGAAAGKVDLFRLRSAARQNERSLWVYTPPEFARSAAPADLLVLLDGWTYLHHIPTPTILDNLRAAGRIPALVAILVDSLDEATRDVELPCHPPFVEFLTAELLPWAQARYQITANPAQTIVAGSSYGALAATFAAFSRPDRFGKVLAQSGSFWWRPPGDPEHEWLARQFAERPPLTLVFYLDVVRLEAHERIRPNQLIANRHMRNVLRAKGYRVHYAEHNGKHEHAAWRDSFASGLLALVGSPPAGPRE